MGVCKLIFSLDFDLKSKSWFDEYSLKALSSSNMLYHVISHRTCMIFQEISQPQLGHFWKLRSLLKDRLFFLQPVASLKDT